MKLETLNYDFIHNVLPSLFQSSAIHNVLGGGSGYDNNEYYFHLNFESLIKVYPAYLPDGYTFVHFTSIKNLHSIINELSIRMYNLNNLNDPNEFKYLIRNFEINEIEIENIRSNTYVFSMCHSSIFESDKILQMWLLYGEKGYGCAIEFEILSPNENVHNILLGKVLYGGMDLSDYIRAKQRFEEKHNVHVIDKELMNLPACLHKKPIFNHEMETRLFYPSISHVLASESLSNESSFKYDFKYNGEIVKYYKLNLYSNDPFCPYIRINKIQFGFKNNLNELENIKSHFLKLIIGIRNIRKDSSIRVPEIQISPLYSDYE